MPATASQPNTLAPVRKPSSKATPMTSTTEMTLAVSEVSTRAHRVAERAMGMEWKRSKMPPCRSVKSR